MSTPGGHAINDAIRGSDPGSDLLTGLGGLIEKVMDGTASEEERDLADKAVIFATAQRMRFRNPEAAVKLIDRAAIQRNSKGLPTNLADLVAELARTDRYLVHRTAHADAGAGLDAAPVASDEGSLTRFIRGR